MAKVSLKLKAVTLAKEIARRQGVCVKCGSTTRQLHGAHIFPVRYGNTAADPNNIISLCAYCHVYAKDSWHESPLENWEWFNQKFPGKYEELRKKAYSLNKPDYLAIYQSLKETYGRVRT